MKGLDKFITAAQGQVAEMITEFAKMSEKLPTHALLVLSEDAKFGIAYPLVCDDPANAMSILLSAAGAHWGMLQRSDEDEELAQSVDPSDGVH